MSGYLIRHLASGTSTIITGSLPLSVDAPQGAGVYEVHALSDPTSITVTAAPTVSVPAAFGAADWSLSDSPSAAGNTLTLTVDALPADGNSAITAIQRRTGAGAEQALSGIGTGARQITVLAGTEASIELRAVNAVGSGPWSTAKVATPTALAGTGSAQFGSVQFPDTNGHTAATNLVLRQSTANMPAPLAADTAFFGIVHVPLVTRNEEEIYTILGDGFGGSDFTVALYGRGGNLGAKANKVICITNDDISSSDLGSVERFLWVAERQGNGVRVGIYPCDGSAPLPGTFKAAVAPGSGAFAWTGSEFRIGDFGSNGTAPADTFLPVNKLRRFPGEMACVGYVSGTVNQSDWESIAAGADPVATLGAANLPWYRNLDGSPASLSAPAGATADSTSAMTVFGTMARGGNIVAQSPTLSLLVDPLPLPGQVYAVKKSNGYTTAQVPLSGTATGRDGQTVEARIRYVQDDSVLMDWTTVGNVAGGAWSGTVTCPRSANGWCYVEVRSTTDTGNVATRMQPFAAGYKLLALGQSQFTIALKGDQHGSTMTNPLNVTYIDPLHNAPSVGSLKAARVGGDFASDFMIELSNTLARYGDTTPIAVIRETVNGTQVTDFLIDAEAERTFDSILLATSITGSDVSVVIHQWGTSDAGASDYGNQHRFLTSPTPEPGLDHCLADAIGTDYEYLVMPLSRHNNGGGVERIRQDSLAWAEANNRPIGPWFSDMQVDEGTGSLGAHQPPTALMGNPNFGAKTGIGVARALGMDTSENPYFSDDITLSADRKKLTVTPVLVNGGTAYSPAPNRLSQFYVSENGGSSFATGGFTARLVDGMVEITKNDDSLFALGSIVRVPSDNRPWESGVWSEVDIVAGTLYETYDKDVLGRGLMVMGGRNSDGTINADYRSNPAALVGVSAPAAGLPTGAIYKGSANLTGNPYLISAPVENTVNPVPWIVPADGTTVWVAAGLAHRPSGNPRPPVPWIFETRDGPSGPFSSMTEFAAGSSAFINGDNLERVSMALQYQTPVANAATIYNSYSSGAYFNLSLWELDPTRFDLSAAQSGSATNPGVPSTSAELAGIPSGSALFAMAYNRDGTEITWNGGTVDHMDLRNYGVSDRRISLMSGTASGNMLVTATAEILIISVVPPL